MWNGSHQKRGATVHPFFSYVYTLPLFISWGKNSIQRLTDPHRLVPGQRSGRTQKVNENVRTHPFLKVHIIPGIFLLNRGSAFRIWLIPTDRSLGEARGREQRGLWHRRVLAREGHGGRGGGGALWTTLRH